MKYINDKNQKKILIVLIIILTAIDQITKIVMYTKGNIIEKLDNSNRVYYLLLSLIILVSIIRYITSKNEFIKFDTKFILSFAIAGLVGNVIDRICLGYVINFIKIPNFININISYIYIFIAWIGMAVILTKNSIRILNDRKLKKEKINGYKNHKSKWGRNRQKNR